MYFKTRRKVFFIEKMIHIFDFIFAFLKICIRSRPSLLTGYKGFKVNLIASAPNPLFFSLSDVEICTPYGLSLFVVIRK